MALNFEQRLYDRVESARGGSAYRNYLRVRKSVIHMMNDWERLDAAATASSYWQEEMDGFLYLFDANPLIVSSLREQCYHITGIKSYEYRSHHIHAAQQFSEKLAALKAVDPQGLFVPEQAALGGFGFEVDGGRVNIDTLKFYEVLIGMERAGILPEFRRTNDRRIVAEVGSGWGGFAFAFKHLIPNATYVCIDLPATMIFSATYILTAMPEARVLMYGDDDFEKKLSHPSEYDFIFVPHFFFPQVTDFKLDLAVNMVSFQEMTTEQVDAYARQFRDMGCSWLYSLNRDRSKHNTQLTTVSEIIGSHYTLRDVTVLEDMQYTHLSPPRKVVPRSVLDYRHYHGVLES